MYAREAEPRGYGNIGIYDLASDELLKTIDVTQHPSHNRNDLKGLAWSPDSQRLAVMYHYCQGAHANISSISIIDVVDTGKEVKILTTHGFYHYMRFHPYMQNVIIVTGHYINIESGTVTNMPTGDYPPFLPPPVRP